MFDLNNCAIEYMYRGKRTKKRAVRHLSGKLEDDPNSYVIVTASTSRIIGNTTGDSFYSYISNKFKNDNVSPFIDYKDLLDKYRETMPAQYLKELETIEASHKEYLEDSNAISENAQAYEILKGNKIVFTELLIPTENFIIRKVDMKN
jgi:hypothetical protein